MLVVALCWVAVGFGNPALAIDLGNIPNPRLDGSWVADTAEVLTDTTEQQLNSQVARFESKTTIEIAVVTVAETQPLSSPKAFATELFNRWGIGKARSNNGVLFLISVGDRRIEIETGLAIDRLLTTAKLQGILDAEIVPKLFQGDFDGALLAGTQAFIHALSAEISVDRLAGEKSIVTRFSQLLGRIFLVAGMAIGWTAICFFLYRQYQNYRDRQPTQKLYKFVHPATVMERGWAVILDLTLLSIIYIVVAYLTVEPYKAPLVLADTRIPIPISIALMLGNLEGAFDLGFLMGWSGFGASLLVYRTLIQATLNCTFGQWSAGIRVIQADDSFLGVTENRLKNLKITEEKSIGLYAAFVRNFMLSVDGFLIYLVGIVAIVRSDKSQRLGDRLAQTVVVCRHIQSSYFSRLEGVYEAGGSFGGGQA